MLAFGHAGLTLGAAALTAGSLGQGRLPARSGYGWLVSLSARLDIRWLLVGSLLPDIIDKPLGLWLLGDTLASGRVYCHTLLFAGLLTLGGWYLSRRGQRWLRALSFGVLAHLVLDQMWLSPQTLFWPLLGTSFPPIDVSGWFEGILGALFSRPDVFIPEILGAGVLIWFLWQLARRHQLKDFLRHGRLYPIASVLPIETARALE